MKRLFKICAGIIIIAGLFLFYVNSIDSNKILNSKIENIDFYSLNDGNQYELLVSTKISEKWLDSIKNQFKWNEFDEYDNRMWEYMYKFFDETVQMSGIVDEDELWLKFNRPQKVFWAFLAFNGDTDNGGVNQFLYNRPKFRYAVSETWKELGLDKLESDYNLLLKELEMSNSILNLAMKLEENYYDENYKKKLYKTTSDYIESEIEKFVIIE